MSNDLDIHAFGPFSAKVASAFPSYYQGVPDGTLVYRSFFHARTGSTAREVMQLLGIKGNDLTTYKLDNEKLLKLDAYNISLLEEALEIGGDNDVTELLLLAREGFTLIADV